MFARRLASTKSFLTVATRSFRSGGVQQTEKPAFDIINADRGVLGKGVYHKLHIVAMVFLPLAFVAPASVSTPIELILSAAIPLHGHIAMNYVISDYVPKQMRTMARVGTLGVTVLMTLGLIKLAMGPGIAKSVTGLWEDKKEKKSESKNSKQ